MYFLVTRYIAKNFLRSLLTVALVFYLIAYFISFLEITQSSLMGEKEILDLFIKCFVENYKNLDMVTLFVFFIATVLTFHRLNKSHEFIALRALGLSPVQILFPILFVALILASFNNFILIPISQNLEEHYAASSLQSSDGCIIKDIWYMEESDGTVDGGRVALHARAFNTDKNELINVTFFIFEDKRLVKRVDAASAIFNNTRNDNVSTPELMIKGDQSWSLSRAYVMNMDHDIKDYKQLMLRMPIAFQDIDATKQSVKQYKNLSHYFHFLQVVFQPILVIAIVLLGYGFSAHFIRGNNVNIWHFIGINVVMVIKLISDVLQQLALQSNISLSLAVFVPILISFLISLHLIIKLEFDV